LGSISATKAVAFGVGQVFYIRCFFLTVKLSYDKVF